MSFVDPTLRDLVKNIAYKPGWMIYIKEDAVEADGSGGPTLMIVSNTENSLRPMERIRVGHPFLIPPAIYLRDVWVAWIFERYRDVETHEAGEFFRADGVREFAPHHSKGENPYVVWHVSDYATAAKKQGDD